MKPREANDELARIVSGLKAPPKSDVKDDARAMLLKQAREIVALENALREECQFNADELVQRIVEARATLQ